MKWLIVALILLLLVSTTAESKTCRTPCNLRSVVTSILNPDDGPVSAEGVIVNTPEGQIIGSWDYEYCEIRMVPNEQSVVVDDDGSVPQGDSYWLMEATLTKAIDYENDISFEAHRRTTTGSVVILYHIDRIEAVKRAGGGCIFRVLGLDRTPFRTSWQPTQ